MTGSDERTRTFAGQTAAVQATAASPKATRAAMSRRHSLAKTVSWRVTATIDTFIISFFVSGRFAWASSIASLEVLTKMGLYYVHDRAGSRVDWG